MTPPVPPRSLFGAIRLHVLKPDTTAYATPKHLSGLNARGVHSKRFDASALTFDGNVLESVLAADETILEDAFVVAQVRYAGGWQDIGTPYMLSPGTGTVIGPDGKKARQQSPVATGALNGLLDELIVFPTQADADHPSFKRCGGVEGNRYFNCFSFGYSEALHTWHDADVFVVAGTGTLVGGGGTVADASSNDFTETAHGLADDDRVRLEITSGATGLSESVQYVVNVTDANTFTLTGADVGVDGVVDVFKNPERKFGKPDDLPEALSGAKWIFRDASEGGRTCARVPDTFTLTEDQRVVFVLCADENAKGHLDGPNHGGVIIDFTADEDGYNQGFGHWSQRLKAGTYRFGAQMLTINSTGGDGNDSMIFGAYSIKTDGTGDVDSVLFVSDENTRVLRQPVTDQIPGMSPGEVMRRALQVCEDVADGDDNAATILLDNRTFTDTLDTDGAAWTTFVEWVWPHRTSLASAFADLLAEIDLDMGTTFSFDAWQDRGADVSADVIFAPGTNIFAYGWQSDSAGPNAYMTESQEGSGLYEGTVPSGQRRRFGGLESGASGTVGRANRNARQAVKANGEARRYYDGEVIAMTDGVPWVDFTLCDVVNGRGYRNLGLDLEVTAMSWAQAAATTVTLTLAEPVT